MRCGPLFAPVSLLFRANHGKPQLRVKQPRLMANHYTAWFNERPKKHQFRWVHCSSLNHIVHPPHHHFWLEQTGFTMIYHDSPLCFWPHRPQWVATLKWRAARPHSPATHRHCSAWHGTSDGQRSRRQRQHGGDTKRVAPRQTARHRSRNCMVRHGFELPHDTLRVYNGYVPVPSGKLT